MSFSWIKRKLDALQKEIENHKSLYWMESWLKNHPYLWKTTKHSVAGGVGLGLFIGFIPLPIQTILAAVLSVFIRVNLPIAVLATWIINPFFFIPANYVIYKTGEFVINARHKTGYPIPKFTLDWHHLSSYSDLVAWFRSVQKIYLIGFPIVSLGTAIAGYLIVFLVWTLYEKFVQISE